MKMAVSCSRFSWLPAMHHGKGQWVLKKKCGGGGWGSVLGRWTNFGSGYNLIHVVPFLV